MATKGPMTSAPKGAPSRSAAPPTPAPSPAPPAPVSSPPAPTASTTPVAPQGPQLKYLGFFRTAVLQFYVFLLQVYDHLKDKSGSFKLGIESVEGTVKTVVGPVLSKAQLDPDAYLAFVDTKIDDGVKYADENIPADWKRQAVSVYGYASQAPSKVVAAVDGFKEKGFAATVQSYYEYFLPIIVAYLTAAGTFILTLPLAPQIISTVQPYVVYVAEQYNTVLSEAQKSDVPVIVSVTRVLPAIPVQKLKKSE